MTLIEVLVVLGVVAILVTLLLAGLSLARRGAHKTVCANNLRQMGSGFSTYFSSQPNGAGGLPRRPSEWMGIASTGSANAVSDQVNRALFTCPTEDRELLQSYAINSRASVGFRGTKGGRVLPKPQIVLVGENRPGSGRDDIVSSLETFEGVTRAFNGPHRHGKFKSQTLWLDLHSSDERPKWEAVLHDPWSPFTAEPRPLQPSHWQQ